jgi:ribose 5-phosphate isomerase
LGSKFNIGINDALERVKLAMNEAVDRSMVVGLGSGITQLNVFSLLEEKFMLNQEKW